MNPVRPTSLGDAYPALCNFLRLTSLALTAPKLALTVQVGQDWRHGGVMNYGQLSADDLKEVLSSQPSGAAAATSPHLSLSTYNRAEAASEAASAPVLVGHIKSADGRYQLTVYVPDTALDTLTEVQVKTLEYLSQQLLLCLAAIQSPPPAPAPEPPLPTAGSGVDFMARVVALDSGGPTHQAMHQGYPRLVDLVAQMQACLSYGQLGQLLGTYLPYFFPHQSGRLVVFSEGSEQGTVLTQWGEAAPLAALERQCCYSHAVGAPPSPMPGVGYQCDQCQVADHCPDQVKADQVNLDQADADQNPHQATQCVVLGMLSTTTCILQLAHIETEAFSLLQTALLQKLSEQILYVMQRLLLLEELQDQALKDPLTGLLNRRHAETVLNSLCQAANGQQNISIILIDIDRFKTINDTYGHQAGDAVLKSIGVLLRGHVRSKDIVCRYGGEEFCMVLLDTSPDVALRRAEKIRRAVKYITTTFDGHVLPPVTISLGVASFPEHGETPHTLITLADKALYWAKNHGRDRAVSVDQMLAGIP
jgi:diguanylate cyclase (GGDEF)-like protein